MNKANFKQKFSKEIKQLADKHDITTDKVVDIYFNQFSFLAKSIRNEENASLKLRGLGTFAFNHKLKDKLIELKQLKNEREILSKSSPKDGDGTQSD